MKIPLLEVILEKKLGFMVLLKFILDCNPNHAVKHLLSKKMCRFHYAVTVKIFYHVRSLLV